MQTSAFIILALLTNSLFAQTNSDSIVKTSRKKIINKDVMTIANQHGVKLKAIQTILVKEVFKQTCMSTIPKRIGTADVSFINSKIGIVTSCFYLKSLRNDTLRSVYIMTENQENTDQLLKQAIKQYGQPKITNNELHTLYIWENKQKNCLTNITLLIENKTIGVLTVEQKK